MTGATATQRARLTAVLREGERVTPLELFFDLVFVLALTQCTALMADRPTWAGMAQGVLVLGVLWWAWTGYAWLTSVLDPEEGAVRLAMFAAMAAMLVRDVRRPHHAVSTGEQQRPGQPRRPGPAPVGGGARNRHRRRCGPDRRRRAAGRAVGSSPWRSTWAARSSTARRAGSWCRPISRSATA